jgi:hypothetical protein
MEIKSLFFPRVKMGVYYVFVTIRKNMIYVYEIIKKNCHSTLFPFFENRITLYSCGFREGVIVTVTALSQKGCDNSILEPLISAPRQLSVIGLVTLPALDTTVALL